MKSAKNKPNFRALFCSECGNLEVTNEIKITLSIPKTISIMVKVMRESQVAGSKNKFKKSIYFNSGAKVTFS
jgi:hypothetical protein